MSVDDSRVDGQPSSPSTKKRKRKEKKIKKQKVKSKKSKFLVDPNDKENVSGDENENEQVSNDEVGDSGDDRSPEDEATPSRAWALGSVETDISSQSKSGMSSSSGGTLDKPFWEDDLEDDGDGADFDEGAGGRMP